MATEGNCFLLLDNPGDTNLATDEAHEKMNTNNIAWCTELRTFIPVHLRAQQFTKKILQNSLRSTLNNSCKYL